MRERAPFNETLRTLKLYDNETLKFYHTSKSISFEAMTLYDVEMVMASLFSNGRHLVSSVWDFTISFVVRGLGDTGWEHWLIICVIKSRGYGKSIIFADVASLYLAFCRRKFPLYVSVKCPKFSSEICLKWDKK